jgi:hypothetical protein
LGGKDKAKTSILHRQVQQDENCISKTFCRPPPPSSTDRQCIDWELKIASLQFIDWEVQHNASLDCHANWHDFTVEIVMTLLKKKKKNNNTKVQKAIVVQRFTDNKSLSFVLLV